MPVHVANPRNKDPLNLDWDANWDAALKVMQEQHRRESHSSSSGAGLRSQLAVTPAPTASHSWDQRHSKKALKADVEACNHQVPILVSPTADY